MNTKPNNKARSKSRGFAHILDCAIQQLGYSLRKSRQIRKAVLAIIASALAAGKSVETPIGTFAVVHTQGQRQRWNAMRATTEQAYCRNYRIVFTPIPELDQILPTMFFTEKEFRLLRRTGYPLLHPWTTNKQEGEGFQALLLSAINPLEQGR